MSDEPGFRRETHATVEPTLEQQAAHWKARALQAERERAFLMADTWHAFLEAGGDPDGNHRWHCDPEMAGRTLLAAVRSLREDYDACPSPEDLQRAERERNRYRASAWPKKVHAQYLATLDERDAALARAEQAERERDTLREALGVAENALQQAEVLLGRGGVRDAEPQAKVLLPVVQIALLKIGAALTAVPPPGATAKDPSQ